MHRLPAVLAATALAAVSFTASPADARIIDRGHISEDFDSGPYSCDGLVRAQDTGTIHIIFRANVRGSSPFPYYVENTRGTAVTTNLETGGTLTQRFNGTGHDHTIVDNGDGTMTVTIYDSGQNQVYDQFGNMVFHDAGSFRFSFDLDYGGTPSDPSDDTDIPDTFQIVREPTGRDDTGDRDFCEDLVTFTSAP